MSKINNPPNGPVKWGEILQYFLLYFQYRAIPEKTEGCWENTFLEKNPENFNFLTLPPGNFRQNKGSPLGTQQNCVKA